MVYRNENGFTLISMILILTIIVVSLPVLVQIIKLSAFTNSYDELSIQQFFYLLRDEANSTTDFNVKENVLILIHEDESKITFKKYKNEIIRQVNRKGHDIYVRDIAEITFIKISYGVIVKVISLEGESYEKTIIFPN